MYICTRSCEHSISPGMTITVTSMNPCTLHDLMLWHYSRIFLICYMFSQSRAVNQLAHLYFISLIVNGECRPLHKSGNIQKWAASTNSNYETLKLLLWLWQLTDTPFYMGNGRALILFIITSLKHFFNVQLCFVIVKRWAVNKISFEIDTDPQSEN